MVAWFLLMLLGGAARADAPAAVRIDEEGLVLASEDGSRTFDLHLMAQGRVDLTRADKAWSAGAQVRRVRPFLRYTDRVHRVTLLLQEELAGPSPTLLDARLDWTVRDGVDLAAGRMIVPFTQAWNTPLPRVLLGDRSILDADFAPGRRVGGTAHLALEDRVVEGWVGLFDAAVTPREGGVAAPMVVVRIQANPIGPLPHDQMSNLDATAAPALGLGAGLLATPGATADDPARATGMVDVGAVARGFSLLAEGFGRVGGARVELGAGLQAAQVLVPDRVQVGGRATVQRLDGADGHVLGEAFVNVYALGPHLYAQLRGTIDAPMGDEAVREGLTLHAQAWF
jgi:hypothetical protein